MSVQMAAGVDGDTSGSNTRYMELNFMNKTVMFPEEKTKKARFITGKIIFPLAVGCRAIVITDQGQLATSTVQKICQIERGLIRFETKNSHYSITLNEPFVPSYVG